MQSRYDTLLFDLDGTLTDSAPGITRSVRHALVSLGIDAPDPAALRQFVGPPLSDSFSEHYRLSPERIARAVDLFHEFFAAEGMLDNRPYDGIDELLGRLSAAGWRLMVATSKPLVFADRILAHFNLRRHFSYVGGASLDESRNQKWQVIEDLLARTGVAPARALMVGDRKHDVLGAAHWGVDCAGVLYGYGSREELERAGAKYLVDSVDGLGRLLL